MRIPQKQVAVGLSGGVDSAVAAYLLREQGFRVKALFMKTWDGSFSSITSSGHTCFGPGEAEDLEQAVSLSARLNISLEVLDLSKEYRSTVIEYVRGEYLRGRTPNPCVQCNQHMKFGLLLQKAREAGYDFDYFATGHYCGVERQPDGTHLLRKAAHRDKDQTYFLYTLTELQLRQTIFPLADMRKEETLRIAADLGYDVSSYRESQDFIDGGDYSVLFSREEMPSGNIRDGAGNIVGTHDGIIRYTRGQRRGLGVSSDRPLYVVKIDAGRNEIIAGSREELYGRTLTASRVFLRTPLPENVPLRIEARIRQNHREAPAIVTSCGKDRYTVLFDEPQMAITPGQHVVFYRNGLVLGGGIIEDWKE